MKTHDAGMTVALAVLALVLAGCGPSKDELAAQARARLEAEKQAEQDAAKGNKAITDMNKKMFGRMNGSTPGAPQTTTAPVQSEPEPAKP